MEVPHWFSQGFFKCSEQDPQSGKKPSMFVASNPECWGGLLFLFLFLLLLLLLLLLLVLMHISFLNKKKLEHQTTCFWWWFRGKTDIVFAPPPALIDLIIQLSKNITRHLPNCWDLMPRWKVVFLKSLFRYGRPFFHDWSTYPPWTPPPNVPPFTNKAFWSGLIKHWLPLLRGGWLISYKFCWSQFLELAAGRYPQVSISIS